MVIRIKIKGIFSKKILKKSKLYGADLKKKKDFGKQARFGGENGDKLFPFFNKIIITKKMSGEVMSMEVREQVEQDTADSEDIPGIPSSSFYKTSI